MKQAECVHRNEVGAACFEHRLELKEVETTREVVVGVRCVPMVLFCMQLGLDDGVRHHPKHGRLPCQGAELPYVFFHVLKMTLDRIKQL